MDANSLYAGDISLAASVPVAYKRVVKIERSAGIVLFRITPDQIPRFLLLDYGSHWDYAKGHVETGEQDLEAAKRELFEETGIDQAEIYSDFAHEIDYFFRSRTGGLIRKTVIFFLARTQQSEVRLSHEHVGFEWLDEAAALKRLSYANARAVLKAAIVHLDSDANNHPQDAR